ncbi:hypothetical protein XJ32_03755 [Helicobacter bilis]|uniref:Toxin-antitoxin system YwqK family antitoxin n=1 Tax=Helicobacter bilis TaxID=37372 RepID=A0A1Q2LHA0_9HELI|nr:toxin-antitoxin system YwqK family antitoxin [Helicobacter bilis]AQQ59352.1 hypothetical protein XJ32_03755 [Helicobacter bilis]
MLLKSVFMGFLSFSILHADTLKECKTEADKISGCVVKEYDENGQLQSETPFKNDKQEGIEKAYYINGNLMAETPYKDNKINGIAKWYYENGNLVIEVSYKNDELHGDLKYYTEDKKLLATINAQNDKFISGKCFNNKVLTDKELKEFRRIGNIDEKIIYLQEICLKSDSK